VSRRLLIALLAALLLPASAAHAALFPGEVIDGPNPGLLAVGGIDFAASDGNGGVVYLRDDGGAAHVFVARILGGAWQPPERVDGAFTAPASDPQIAAGTGGELIVAWVVDNTLVVNVKPNANAPWSGPQAVSSPALLPSLDMGYNDNAYLAWSNGQDVYAARMPRGATSFSPVNGPLDLDPARTAGAQENTRVSISVSAEGLALAAWGEVDATGRSHVVARRINGQTLSPAPAEIGVDQLDGRPGGDADAPQAVVQSDSSFGQVVFRQAFVDGGVTETRALARRMRGSAFEPPVPIDGQNWPAQNVGPPSVVLSGGGTGFAAAPWLAGVSYARGVNAKGEWNEFPTRLDSAPVPLPGRIPVFYSEDKHGIALFPGIDGMIHAREITGIAFGGEPVITKPDFGPVDWGAGVVVGGDRYYNGAVVAIQGTGADRRLVATISDRPPGGFSPDSHSQIWYSQTPSRLSWYAPNETWGGLRYTLEIDGEPVATTTKTSYPTDGLRLGPGVHLWRVVATDLRGQTSATPTRLLRLDPDGPNVTISFEGAQRAGRRVTIRVRAIDTLSGSLTPTIHFGDGGSEVGRSASHVYRKGRYTVTVTAPDKAGNVTTERRTLVIR
jgi:hypothetical protein